MSRIPQISKKRIFIRKIKNFFKPKPKKLTLMEMIAKINKENHFKDFDDNLISEIYTHLLSYGNITVKKESEYKYYMTLFQKIDESNESMTELEITEDGLFFVE